ncbi:LexA family protein [Spirosoma arcticum]
MRNLCSATPEITLYDIADFKPVLLPKFALNVECGNSTTGFASPADDYIETSLDLNEFHNIRKHRTFLVAAVGDSMIDAGITENDLLIVDTSLEYREGDIVICCLNGSYKAKMLKRVKGQLYLKSRNLLFAPIEIQEHDDLRIFGVVKGLSRNFRRD